ncbi:hypothetical protein [Halomarina rubra]|uniref:Uncharacterized protein n=1 Tax=Halomarina rubra TaxID=2071873 RepID=A0ABD6AXW1_9EURY|nr:hypothetical protein [Halomarina rubra]
MALPAPLGHLLRPAETFADRRTAPALAVGLVVCVALLHAVSVGVVAGAFTDVSGTVTVDNPEYPGDWQCDPDGYDPFDQGTPADCAQPERVDRSLGAHASRAVGGYALTAFVAVVVGWPLLAWLVHVVAVPGRAGFGRTLFDSAWAVVPLSLVAVARLVAVPPRAADLNPGTLDEAAASALELTFGPETTLLVGVAVLAATWSGYVAYGVAANRTDADATGGRGVWTQGRSDGRGAVAGVVVTTALVVGTFVPMLPIAGGTAFVALFVVAAGLVIATFARGIILHNTRWDLVGMRGGETGEPTRWRVLLKQLSGIAFAVLGFFMMNGGQVLV